MVTYKQLLSKIKNVRPSDKIKLSRNFKGYNWSIETSPIDIEHIADLNNQLKNLTMGLEVTEWIKRHS